MKSTKHAILQDVKFGTQIAEEEADALANSYFVETDQWRRLYAGDDVDGAYGSKGSGKSALYSLLLRRQPELAARGVLIVAAENPQGATVFRDLKDDPPVSEAAFAHYGSITLSF